jgi:hypothetical protein
VNAWQSIVWTLLGALGCAAGFLWAAGRARRLERERIAREAAIVNFRQGTAQHLTAINEAVQQLVKQREPTLPELQHFLQARNLWCGTVGDMQQHFTALGYVVLSTERWHEIVQRLGPGGMTNQEWIDRED